MDKLPVRHHATSSQQAFHSLMSEGLLKHHMHPSLSFVAQSKVVTLTNWAQLCFMLLPAQQEEEGEKKKEEEGEGSARAICLLLV